MWATGMGVVWSCHKHRLACALWSTNRELVHRDRALGTQGSWCRVVGYSCRAWDAGLAMGMPRVRRAVWSCTVQVWLVCSQGRSLGAGVVG